MAEPPSLKDIRSPLDLDNLKSYLSKVNSSSPKTQIGFNSNIPRSFTIAKQFTFGQSNPTYYLEDSNGSKFVLRRKPSPNAKIISKTAHAIEKEFFIINAINQLNNDVQDKDFIVPVPTVHLLCEDESIIGYVFYLMDYVEGLQIKNPSLPGFSNDDKNIYYKSIINTIVGIHKLDVEKLLSILPIEYFPQFQNIEKLKTTSYFKRQIKTLTNIHNLQSKHVDPIPNFEKLTNWFIENAPEDPSKLTLIHGDLKIDNLLFNPTTKKVCGVLDWELCTIGHPLFDLSNFFQPFQFPQQMNQLMFQDPENEMGLGNPESEQFLLEQLKNYSKLIKWNPEDPSNDPIKLWKIGHTFGLLRLCVISQGIAMRVKQGNASSASAKQYAEMYPFLSELAVDYAFGEHSIDHKSKI
ncbi:uncharacterized protein KGF55_003766 [Candida pseudojiufengensis]|uniref:uncharacterized protein n=1 Tax=Candida pseudojiufengensis TaxID=497109 RepID=UPI002224979E|nr:uncharacterized protein KGF55_003766 [Candida pseudojiufengensis]KAI5962690.1 hypothetical protein KGF55_003766 [Candida pseudojiufengensis]